MPFNNSIDIIFLYCSLFYAIQVWAYVKNPATAMIKGFIRVQSIKVYRWEF